MPEWAVCIIVVLTFVLGWFSGYRLGKRKSYKPIAEIDEATLQLIESQHINDVINLLKQNVEVSKLLAMLGEQAISAIEMSVRVKGVSGNEE